MQSDARARRTLCTSDTPHYEQMPFEVPSSWEWTEVGNIGEIVTGSTPSKDIPEYYGGDIPFYKPTDLEQGKCVKRASDHLSLLGFEHARKLPVKSVLITCIGATIGKTGLITIEGSCNQQINAIIPHDFILAEFIYDVCTSDYFQDEIKFNASATTLPILNKGNFAKLLFPLPPLAEQIRIVAEIEKWFALIDQVEEEKGDLQVTIKQARSKILDIAIHGKLVPQDPDDEPASELLKRINPKAEITCDNGQYGKMPKGWCLVTGTSLFKQMKSAKPKGELFKYIDIDSVDNKSNIVSSIKEIPTIEAPSRASRYTEKGDVIFSMVRPYLRNIARITENDCIASTGFYICSPYNCMLSKFCYYLMLSNYVVDGLNTFMKGDNSPSITKREIENWLYPLPPMNEQYRIVAKIEKIFTILDRIELSLRMS